MLKEEEDDDENSHHPEQLTVEAQEQLWQQLQQLSKHSLLQTLQQQICHINDVAALIDEWVPAHVMSWSNEREELGFCYKATDPIYWSHSAEGPASEHRMRQLQHKVMSALSIGFVGIRFLERSEPPLQQRVSSGVCWVPRVAVLQGVAQPAALPVCTAQAAAVSTRGSFSPPP